MIIKVGGLEPLGPIGVYAYAKRQALGCRLSPKFVLFKLHALHKRPLEISPNFVVFRHAKTAAPMYASAHQFTFVVAKTVEIRGINGQKPRC